MLNDLSLLIEFDIELKIMGSIYFKKIIKNFGGAKAPQAFMWLRHLLLLLLFFF